MGGQEGAGEGQTCPPSALFLMALLLLQGSVLSSTLKLLNINWKKGKKPKCCKDESQCPPPVFETDEGDGIKSGPSNNHMAAQPRSQQAKTERDSVGEVALTVFTGLSAIREEKSPGKK